MSCREPDRRDRVGPGYLRDQVDRQDHLIAKLIRLPRLGSDPGACYGDFSQLVQRLPQHVGPRTRRPALRGRYSPRISLQGAA